MIESDMISPRLGDPANEMIEELEVRRRPSWQTPYHWWGPTWKRPMPRDLDALAADGVVTSGTAETLRATVQEGASILVAAGPAGVGKSTVADALVGALPPATVRVYLRGSHETFDMLDAPRDGHRALLVNELSPHLPIYLWGEAARRVLRFAKDGFQLLGTIHASSPEELIYQLARSPVGATPDEIAAIGTVVFLGPPAATIGPPWPVTRLVGLHATVHGVRVEDVAIDK